ncbi:alpha/beta fold hydrolase [Methylocystis sp. JAN1]|uniref:alpha/beta fold hydrolase n=1 Tax=Methylocystis sp. JAN1 TaxID=3397211 RepID=UPI003FA1D741
MSWDIWTRDLWALPFATMEAWRRALEPPPVSPPREGPHWTTPARMALKLGLLRLWDFSVPGADATPVVILSPYALHDAQLADLAPAHSLVGALLGGGRTRLHLVEWTSATFETQLCGIDHLLAELNVAIDDIGAPVDLVGLCQGGWLALLHAARFPQKIRRMAVIGSPIDMAAEASVLSEPVDRTSDFAIDRLIAAGGGVVKGAHMAPLWPRETCAERRIVDALQIEPPFEAACEAVAAFQAWDRRLLDLPAPYYREVVQYLYRDNLLSAGGFPALGRRVDLSALDQPLFLLAGSQDGVTPPAQLFALKNIVRGAVETAVAPCGHLALFMGRRTIENEWRRIAGWLSGDEANHGK